MARKVFISFLGAGNYVETCYKIGDRTSAPVRFIQEALFDQICQDWSVNDRIYIFFTTGQDGKKGSYELNWLDNGQERAVTSVEKIGLQSRLKDKSYYRIVEGIQIKEGFSEDEIWDIFSVVYGKLENGDKIHFDVTHAFRTIPIFSTILFNFSTFMKNTELVSVHYGAFEKLGPSQVIREWPVEKRIAPVLDLTSIVQLQDLTQVASDYREFGNIKNISTILDYKPQDKKFNIFVKNLQSETTKLEEYILTNKIGDIKKGEFVWNIKSNLKNIRKKGMLTYPQDLLLSELEKAISGFEVGGEDKNILAAVNWALKYDMVQQAYTLAEEYLISLATEKFKSYCFYSNEDDIKWRKYMSAILGVNQEVVNNQNFNSELSENVNLTNQLFSDELVLKIRKFYLIISANRNILCHGKPTSLTIKQFREQLVNNFDKCRNLLSTENSSSNGD